MGALTTTLADLGWLVVLWLFLPVAIVAIGLPVVLIVRAVLALVGG